MQSITSSAELKNTIQFLEIEHDIKGRQLKDQLYITYESLKPINLLRSTLKEITSSRYMIDDISGTAMGMAGGFLSKKLFIGKSGSAFRKLIGLIIQFGITNLVSKNSEVIKSFSQSLFQYFFHKKNEFQ